MGVGGKGGKKEEEEKEMKERWSSGGDEVKNICNI